MGWVIGMSFGQGMAVALGCHLEAWHGSAVPKYTAGVSPATPDLGFLGFKLNHEDWWTSLSHWEHPANHPSLEWGSGSQGNTGRLWPRMSQEHLITSLAFTPGATIPNGGHLLQVSQCPHHTW